MSSKYWFVWKLGHNIQQCQAPGFASLCEPGILVLVVQQLQHEEEPLQPVHLFLLRCQVAELLHPKPEQVLSGKSHSFEIFLPEELSNIWFSLLVALITLIINLMQSILISLCLKYFNYPVNSSIIICLISSIKTSISNHDIHYSIILMWPGSICVQGSPGQYGIFFVEWIFCWMNNHGFFWMNILLNE